MRRSGDRMMTVSKHGRKLAQIGGSIYGLCIDTRGLQWPLSVCIASMAGGRHGIQYKKWHRFAQTGKSVRSRRVRWVKPIDRVPDM